MRRERGRASGLAIAFQLVIDKISSVLEYRITIPNASSAGPELQELQSLARKQHIISIMPPTQIVPDDHKAYMRLALSLARKSPPKPSNFCVGAVLLDEPNNTILATGYTLELEGNKHAEQCCFSKYASEKGVKEYEVGTVLPAGTVLYTTMEPCNKRSSGNKTCVERIIEACSSGPNRIDKVYVGVKEPVKFVEENSGQKRLEAIGVEVVHVPGLEEEILAVATAGH